MLEVEFGCDVQEYFLVQRVVVCDKGFGGVRMLVLGGVAIWW